MADLLLECFSEEMPARMQRGAMEQLRERLSVALKDARLKHEDITTYVSPRHLAIRINGLPATQPDQIIERKGPKTSAPDKAVEGFLKSTGLTKDQLEVRSVGKDECYFAVIHEKGGDAKDALQEVIERVLGDFTWPKSMRWGAHSIHWVRPLHSLLCLFDSDVIPVRFGHITAGNITYGHRFLRPEAITITHADEYVDALKAAHVMVDHDARKAVILKECERIAAQHKLTLHQDDALLEEVTGLVEWPTVILGAFDIPFLELPKEVLISEMRYHQKYFALYKDDDSLSNHFLMTANMAAEGEHAKTIAHGNARVLRARLSDGQFYWDQDRARPLSDWNHDLEGMIFHTELGSVTAKVKRITSLSLLLAVFVPHANLTLVERAAELCKADLVTGMVGEFPDLQGVMGRYYALAQEENVDVASAIRDHYKPTSAHDDVPTAPLSITVSLADKLDSLMGLFAIGEKPTGSKDPYALRRAALGVIRIILENDLRLPLGVMFDKAAAQYHKKIFNTSKDEVVTQLTDFFADRLKVILRDQGVRHDMIHAVMAERKEDDLVAIVAKAYALCDFLQTDDGENLLAAYRRASNILSVEEKKDGFAHDGDVNESLFAAEEEKALFAMLERIETPVHEACEQENYVEAMTRLAALRAPVDAYFDKVMVNDKDADVRINRLHTLHRIRTQIDRVADFSLIEG